MKKHFLMLFAAAIAMAFVSTSCTKDDEKEGIDFKTAELTASAPVEIEYAVEGASYPVRARIRLESGKLIAEGVATHPNDAAVSAGAPGTANCMNAAVIADYGKAKSLAAIKTIPAETEFGAEATVAENEGYVIEVHGTARFTENYGVYGLKDPGKTYIRLCVLDQTASGVYSVKYSVPFIAE